MVKASKVLDDQQFWVSWDNLNSDKTWQALRQANETGEPANQKHLHQDIAEVKWYTVRRNGRYAVLIMLSVAKLQGMSRWEVFFAKDFFSVWL